MNHATTFSPASRYFILSVFAVVILAVATRPLAAQITEKTFALRPNPSVTNCFGDSATVTVSVVRGHLNDTLTITGDNFLPDLHFDLFTVQHSILLSNGTLNPDFTDFGLAWYQSDLHADPLGHFGATIRQAE